MLKASLVAQRLKRLPPMRETRVRSLGREDPLEKEMLTHSSILAWRIPWMEKPGRLQSTGSQRVGHYWATSPSPSNDNLLYCLQSFLFPVLQTTRSSVCSSEAFDMSKVHFLPPNTFLPPLVPVLTNGNTSFSVIKARTSSFSCLYKIFFKKTFIEV